MLCITFSSIVRKLNHRSKIKFMKPPHFNVFCLLVDVESEKGLSIESCRLQGLPDTEPCVAAVDQVPSPTPLRHLIRWGMAGCPGRGLKSWRQSSAECSVEKLWRSCCGGHFRRTVLVMHSQTIYATWNHICTFHWWMLWCIHGACNC